MFFAPNECKGWKQPAQKQYDTGSDHADLITQPDGQRLKQCDTGLDHADLITHPDDQILRQEQRKVESALLGETSSGTPNFFFQERDRNSVKAFFFFFFS